MYEIIVDSKCRKCKMPIFLNFYSYTKIKPELKIRCSKCQYLDYYDAMVKEIMA